MIKAFGVRNYTCFQNWMELDCTLNEEVPEKFHNGYHIAPILCLKGANASGKTNAIKAIVFLKNFIMRSFTDSAESSSTLDTFFNNDDPTEFYIEFVTKDKTEYLYELKLDENYVYYEKLTRNKEIILDRELQELKTIKLFNDFKISFKPNVSVISAAFYYPETQNAVSSIHSFFKNIFTNVTRHGFTEYPDILADGFRANLFSKLYKNDGEAFVFMQTFLKRFDTGIEEVRIGSQHLPDGKAFYYPVFTHCSNGISYTLLDENESSGTRALFTNLIHYYYALNSGGLLLLDEFDVNLHPDILPCLIELFLSQETNPNNAQLIFITHNNDVMQIAGKHRTYLFEKEDNQSYCYRLDELDSSLIRNDNPIAKLYKTGLLGGIPKIAYGL